MRVLRICLALLLSLLLGVTGQGMAFARGAAPAEDRVMICAGHVTKLVYLDADGQPTAPPELCADCLHVLTGVPKDPLQIAAPARIGTLSVPMLRAVHEPGLSARVKTARAPPRCVI